MMSKIKIKLAEALLRRKELQQKVLVLSSFKREAFFEIRVNRIKVSDGIDEVTANVPKLTASQLTHEFDWHARQLRMLDAQIQQANWTCELEIDPSVVGDYVTPKE